MALETFEPEWTLEHANEIYIPVPEPTPIPTWISNATINQLIGFLHAEDMSDENKLFISEELLNRSQILAHREAICAANGIEVFLSLLAASDSNPIQLNVIKVLIKLLKDSYDNREIFCDQNGMEVFFSRLNHADLDIKTEIIYTLSFLMATNPFSKKKLNHFFHQAGSVEGRVATLVGLLQVADQNFLTNTNLVLAFLMDTDLFEGNITLNNQRSFRDAGGVSALISLLQGSNHRLIGSSLLALIILNDEVIRGDLGVAALSLIMQPSHLNNSDESYLLAFVLILYKLAIFPINHEAIKATLGIPVLVSFLQHPNHEVVSNSITVLAILSESELNHEAIREAGANKALLSFLKVPADKGSQINAIGILGRLAKSEVSQREIRAGDGVDIAIRLLRTPPEPDLKNNLSHLLDKISSTALELKLTSLAIKDFVSDELERDMVRLVHQCRQMPKTLSVIDCLDIILKTEELISASMSIENYQLWANKYRYFYLNHQRHWSAYSLSLRSIGIGLATIIALTLTLGEKCGALVIGAFIGATYLYYRPIELVSFSNQERKLGLAMMTVTQTAHYPYVLDVPEFDFKISEPQSNIVVPAEIHRLDTVSLLGLLNAVNTSISNKQAICHELALNHSREHRAVIREAGGIAILVDLLNSNDLLICEYSALILCNMAEASVANQQTLCTSGAINLFISWLTSMSTRKQQLAAVILAHLVKSTAGHEAMRQLGAMEILVKYLSSSDDIKKRAALYALGCLAQFPSNQSAIFSAGAIEPLLRILVNPSLQEHVVFALRGLVESFPAQEAMVDGGVIPSMVWLLTSHRMLTKRYASGALLLLAQDKGYQKKINESGALAPLRDLEVSDDRKTQQHASMLIEKLSPATQKNHYFAFSLLTCCVYVGGGLVFVACVLAALQPFNVKSTVIPTKQPILNAKQNDFYFRTYKVNCFHPKPMLEPFCADADIRVTKLRFFELTYQQKECLAFEYAGCEPVLKKLASSL